MKIPEEATLLRIFLGESDHHEGKPLYEAIVLKARELHMGGATVLRGLMGFGRSSRLHTTKLLRLSEDLPIVVEIADAEEKIESLFRLASVSQWVAAGGYVLLSNLVGFVAVWVGYRAAFMI
jgi:PII-like signaling protein